MSSLLIYDLETSGLMILDQVLQFAAIRLDRHTLEEIERYNVEVAWRRDMVPSVDAYLVHQLGVDRPGIVAESVAVVEMHQALNQPGTMSGGYNTLGFDDEMLRFAFYRTLLPPYTHQYQNQCGRFDLLPMVVFYYLYAPDTLIWPKKDNGLPSFKLEDFNRENQWVEGRSHDAMNDVEATVAMLRHLRLNKPMWDYLLGYFDKQTDQKRVNDLMAQEGRYAGVGMMIHLRFGQGRHYQAPVLHLGPHHVYKNQLVFLRLDEPLGDLSDDTIMPLMVKKKLGEPGFVLPYVDRYTKNLPHDTKMIVDANLEMLANADISEFVQHCRHQMYDSIEGVDLDAMLYQQSFLSKDETDWCTSFHLAQNKGALLEQHSNPVLQEQALRYLWRFFPEQIPGALQSAAEVSIKSFVHQGLDFKGQVKQTPQQALSRIDAVAVEADKGLQEGMMQLKNHAQTILEEIEAP
ncbi:exonuclease domain-containing protein [Candidatus Synchoanobacter obligatus]|uniref:Exodeoxyribonuclease I n=1 Tax=Candidatus Synchoanobacter obligatus TaxID=2919597 RepID=A0ABT1L525_9GAMM|nr:exonuclease domain-containing protein [Candidatus Synchoanobacter obligatus]MCP8352282.1 exodeoxyribonuclease I [Candidatus Synchoanobacter obligatus]